MADGIQDAIEIIESSRQTHVLWRDHWLATMCGGLCETCAPTAEVAGDLDHQVQCVENYDKALRVLRSVEEIDRNARAYGWEVGRGHLMVDKMADCDPANPFLDSNWREHVQS